MFYRWSPSWRRLFQQELQCGVGNNRPPYGESRKSPRPGDVVTPRKYLRARLPSQTGKCAVAFFIRIQASSMKQYVFQLAGLAPDEVQNNVHRHRPSSSSIAHREDNQAVCRSTLVAGVKPAKLPSVKRRAGQPANCRPAYFAELFQIFEDGGVAPLKSFARIIRAMRRFRRSRVQNSFFFRADVPPP